MNINEFKKHLHAVHNTLDDPSLNNQMRDRLNGMNEGPVDSMVEYKPDPKVDKSTDAPTTAAGDSLRPKSKTAAVKEGAADASAAGGKKKKVVVEEDDIDESVVAYFQNYFGDSLNEDTSIDDIANAVNDLIYLCEAVCDVVGLKKNLTVDEAFPREVSTPLGDLTAEPTNLANKQGVTIKPSPEQLRTAIAKAKDDSPIVQTGQGDYTKTVRPSEIRAKKRAKRIKRMAKFGK